MSDFPRCAVGEKTSAKGRLVLWFSFVSALFLLSGAMSALAGQFPANPQAAAFTGGWCAQGDPNKHASISDNGAFLTLTNENGDTSMGNYQGTNQISAPGWQFATGTLSADGQQIQWSNGTFWARCGGGGGGGAPGHRLNLNGTWYSAGKRAEMCVIRQHGNNLRLSNEAGVEASGRIDGRRHLMSYWNGNPIGGTVTKDGNRINWDNGTYWVRFLLY